MQTLEQTLATAKAEWQAAGCPRGDHPLFLAAQAAAKAVAAAKNAETAARAAEVSAKLSAFAQAGGKAVSAQAQAAAHERVIRRAHEWPRCGQGFPANAVERAAHAWALTEFDSFGEALEGLEVFS